MSRWVVHIGAGRWQLAAITATKKRGYLTLAVDGNDKAEGLELADEALVVGITDEQKTLRAVIKFFEKQGISPKGVLCIASEAGQLSAALIRDHYELPGLSFEMAKKLTDKSLQRSFWSSEPFSPEFVIIDLEKRFEIPVDLQSERVIVKPVDSAGSRGITVIKEPNAQVLENAIKFATDYSKSKKAIVERYIDGQEYTLESIVVDGQTYPLVITEKHKVHGTNGTVANKLASANLSDVMSKRIVDTVSKGHKLLEYRNGVSHAEVIVDEREQVWIVEIAGRGAGFAVSEKYIEFCTGYPYLKTSIDFSLSDIIDAPTKLEVLPSCIRFFESIEGTLEEFYIPSIENVESASLFEKGTVMKQATTDADRMGYAMVKGKTQLEYEELLRKVEESVKVKISVE